jgi:hypothetical protein
MLDPFTSAGRGRAGLPPISEIRLKRKSILLVAVKFVNALAVQAGDGDDVFLDTDSHPCLNLAEATEPLCGITLGTHGSSFASTSVESADARSSHSTPDALSSTAANALSAEQSETSMAVMLLWMTCSESVPKYAAARASCFDLMDGM